MKIRDVLSSDPHQKMLKRSKRLAKKLHKPSGTKIFAVSDEALDKDWMPKKVKGKGKGGIEADEALDKTWMP